MGRRERRPCRQAARAALSLFAAARIQPRTEKPAYGEMGKFPRRDGIFLTGPEVRAYRTTPTPIERAVPIMEEQIDCSGMYSEPESVCFTWAGRISPDCSHAAQPRRSFAIS